MKKYLFLFLVMLWALFPAVVLATTYQVAAFSLNKGETLENVSKGYEKFVKNNYCLRFFANKDDFYKVVVTVPDTERSTFLKENPNAFRVSEEKLKKEGFSVVKAMGGACPSEHSEKPVVNRDSVVAVKNTMVMNSLEALTVKGDMVYLYGKGDWQYVELEGLKDPDRIVVRLFNAKNNSKVDDILFPLPFIDRLRVLYDEKNKETKVVFYPSAPLKVSLAKEGKVIKLSFNIAEDERGIRVVGKNKVSFDLRGADLGDVLRIFSEITGLNFVVDPDVKGNVTLRMTQVDAMKALDAILKSQGLIRIEEDKNVYRITSLEKLAKDFDKLDEAYPVITRIFRLKNISVSALEGEGTCGILSETKTITTTGVFGGGGGATKGSEEDRCDDIKDAFKTILSPRGKMEIIQAINGIIVTDRKNRIDMIEKILKEIDAPKPQVQINARIVEISSSYTKELGIQWGFLWRQDATSLQFPYKFRLGGGTSSSPIGNYTGFASGLVRGFVVDMPATVGPGSGASLAATLLNRLETFGVDVRLSALEDRGLSKTISSPRVIVLDNNPAVIVQGFQIPYKVATQNVVVTQFVVAALRLKVIPHVSSDGSILMEVVVSKDSPDFTNITPEGVPIKVREVKTRVKMRQGDTLVIGGIYEIGSGTTTNSVPGVNRVPLLKWLFTHEQETLTKTEILVFITPTVVRESVN